MGSLPGSTQPCENYDEVEIGTLSSVQHHSSHFADSKAIVARASAVIPNTYNK
jgi:hypothetical protein